MLGWQMFQVIPVELQYDVNRVIVTPKWLPWPQVHGYGKEKVTL